MAKDKVMHPPQAPSSRTGSFKQVNSSIIKGPTQTSENTNPYNRKAKGK